MDFFQDFNFDTLLALISCIVGIIALFVGGAAYKNCKIQKDSLNDEKEFRDNSSDHSIKAGGDVTYNGGMSGTEVVSIMDAMSALSRDNFSMALDTAYTKFQDKCDENLRNIITEAERIVQEHKLQISGYTKIDWIHIYFESAKNSSDTYMQNVWAKVLTRELSHPDSFSYKTLEVLKNMSSNEFKLFEKLCNIRLHGSIINDSDFLKAYGFNWMVLQKLKEFGLISLDSSKRTVAIDANGTANQFISDLSHVLIFSNTSTNNETLYIPCYLFTSVSNELLNIVSSAASDSIATSIGNQITKECNNPNVKITLHRVTAVLGDQVAYNRNVNLLSTSNNASETSN